jgi:hypothetical protein
VDAEKEAGSAFGYLNGSTSHGNRASAKLGLTGQP